MKEPDPRLVEVLLLPAMQQRLQGRRGEAASAAKDLASLGTVLG